MPEKAVDSIAVQITGLFLLWVAAACLPFLGRKAGYRRGWIPLHPWMFLAVSLGICGLSGVFILAVGPSNLLLGLALGVGIGLSLFHPLAAVSFFTANLLTRPWELLPYSEVLSLIPRMLAGVTVLSWTFHRFRTRDASITWGFGPTVFTALLLWIAACIVASPTLSEDLPVLFKTFLPIYVLALLILNSVEDQTDMSLIKNAITLSVTGVIATAIYMTLSDPRFFTVGLRLQGAGLLGNSNDLAAMIALAAPLPAVALLRKEAAIRARMSHLACLIIMMSGLLLSQSRGAIISLAAAGVGYSLIVSKSARKTLIRIAMLLPLPLLFMMAIKRDSSDMQGSSDSRLNYMVTGFKMVMSNPVFGVGMNNYPRRYEQFTSVFHEWGERTAHSTWVLFMSESGFIGLGLFCLLYFSVMRRSWKFRKAAPEYPLAMLSYGVAMSFLSHSYTFFPYLIIFTVIAATRVNATGDLYSADGGRLR